MKTVLLSLSTLLAGAVVAAPAMAQGPTDPQIAAIVVAANQVGYQHRPPAPCARATMPR